MFNIYDEIINGNVDYFYDLLYYDKEKFISNIVGKSTNKKEILNRLLPIFRNYDNWYGLSYQLFKLIYLDNEFKDYTFYLLHKEYVKIVNLKEEELKNILEYTTWGFDYILYNLRKCLDNPKVYKIISILVEYTKDDQVKYQIVKERIMNFDDQELRDDFILSSLNQHASLLDDDIKANLYRNTDDYYYHQEVLPFCKENISKTHSKIPAHLIFWCKKDDNFKAMFLENFDLFLNAEENNKMKIIEYFYDYLPEETKEKYKNIYKLYKTQPIDLIDRYITILMNDKSNFLSDLIKDQELSYITSGSTTSVFRVGDLVLKLTGKKHEMNTERDLFLIAKTDTKLVYDEYNNPILIVEIQKYLDKSYNNKEMTVEDINNFFSELNKLGYIVTDPNCLDKNFDNFGFLDDYHDANLGDYSSHEELPDWFKERPIVLYDIDLVYKKDAAKKKKFARFS